MVNISLSDIKVFCDRENSLEDVHWLNLANNGELSPMLIKT